MKIFDLLKICYLKAIRNKKNKYIFILYILCVIVTLFAITIQNNILYFITNTITENIGFRTLSVSADLNSEDYGENKIKMINHVVSVYNSKYDSASVKSSFKTDKLDGYIELIYSEKNILPKKIIGSSIKDTETEVAICPINFYPSSDAFNLFVNNNNSLNGYDLLNKTFKIEYYSHKLLGQKIVQDKKYNKSFKIIGLYNNNEMMMANNICYISLKDMKEIQDISMGINESSVYGFMVIVDRKDNIDYVLQELKQLGINNTTVRAEIDTSLVQPIILSCNIILTLIIVSIILLTNSFIKKKMINDSKSIGLLRANGYNKKTILLIYLNEFLFLSITAYFIGVLIFQILYIVLKNFVLSSIMYSGFQINLFIINYLIVFILFIILISLINYINIYRYLNSKIVILLRREE